MKNNLSISLLIGFLTIATFTSAYCVGIYPDNQSSACYSVTSQQDDPPQKTYTTTSSNSYSNNNLGTTSTTMTPA